MEAADPVTAVVATGFRNFERSMAMLPALARRRMTHNVIDLFETLCLHHGTRLGAMKSDPRGERLDVVLRFIDEHLADPDLDPEMVARAHFMSVRALHKLAHESGTSIAGWIRHRRLENCKADLANPAWRSMSVAAIGARWGLTRASHFTTLFRAEYGMTPSAYRQSCL
jgi:AraC-like DNA-binding protein